MVNLIVDILPDINIGITDKFSEVSLLRCCLSVSAQRPDQSPSSFAITFEERHQLTGMRVYTKPSLDTAGNDGSIRSKWRDQTDDLDSLQRPESKSRRTSQICLSRVHDGREESCWCAPSPPNKEPIKMQITVRRAGEEPT